MFSSFLTILCLASSEAFLQPPARRAVVDGAAVRKLPSLGFGFFGGGKKSPPSQPGLVRQIDFDTIDRNKTVAFMQDWAADVSLTGVGEECPYPLTPVNQDYGVVFPMKEVDYSDGQVKTVGDLVMDVPEANPSGSGCILITRANPVKNTPFDGEMLIVATFLEALSRVATSGDPQNPTAPGDDEIDFSNWGSSEKKS